MQDLPVFEDLPGRKARLETAFKRLDPSLRVPTQAIGRRYAIGCVAMEITQRCNLDCTLCYLSESSEKVKDIPLALVMDRLQKVRDTYGDGVGVQITGGDPTLRKREELVAIVKRAAELGLEPSLMTNGIKLTRDLGQELKSVGLTDVAIHVDLTQERKRYATEEDLNAVRKEYIERMRGLGLHVIFNTTVYDGNFDQIPGLIKFFAENADVVNLASFQIQADTGRGVIKDRSDGITLKSVRAKIAEATGNPDLNWDNIRVGHPDCNSIAYTLVSKNGTTRFADLNVDPSLFAEIISSTTDLKFSRMDSRKTSVAVAKWALGQPRLLALLLRSFVKVSLRNGPGMWFKKNDPRKLTLIIHNFMDASDLDPMRVSNCSFMVATDKGFVSMCAHNAARETFIRRPLTIETPEGKKTWNPLTGTYVDDPRSLQLPVSTYIPANLAEIPVPQVPVSTLPVAMGAGGK